eukprot:363740-Chlamydomonas_euryale.AAC.19
MSVHRSAQQTCIPLHLRIRLVPVRSIESLLAPASEARGLRRKSQARATRTPCWCSISTSTMMRAAKQQRCGGARAGDVSGTQCSSALLRVSRSSRAAAAASPAGKARRVTPPLGAARMTAARSLTRRAEDGPISGTHLTMVYLLIACLLKAGDDRFPVVLILIPCVDVSLNVCGKPTRPCPCTHRKKRMQAMCPFVPLCWLHDTRSRDFTGGSPAARHTADGPSQQGAHGGRHNGADAGRQCMRSNHARLRWVCMRSACRGSVQAVTDVNVWKEGYTFYRRMAGWLSCPAMRLLEMVVIPCHALGRMPCRVLSDMRIARSQVFPELDRHLLQRCMAAGLCAQRQEAQSSSVRGAHTGDPLPGSVVSACQ